MLVDSHCHLDFPKLTEDREGVLARADAAGVKVMQTIGTKLSSFTGRTCYRGTVPKRLVFSRCAPSQS